MCRLFRGEGGAAAPGAAGGDRVQEDGPGLAGVLAVAAEDGGVAELALGGGAVGPGGEDGVDGGVGERGEAFAGAGTEQFPEIEAVDARQAEAGPGASG